MRRKRHEEHINHEAWAIPYADLMTLLLAFFVVMYAVSVVNVGKYKVMSESMMNAFNGHPGAVVPLPAQKTGQTTPSTVPAAKNAPAAVIKLPIPLHGSHAQSSEAVLPKPPGTLKRIEDLVQQAMQPLINKKLVVLRRTQNRLEIEIRTDILFSSGEAKLSASASQVLVRVAAILAPFPNALRVEGFTDNVPIRTAKYPSNWELSAARAASVARLFAGHGVQPDRLGIVGWSDVRPVASNDTAEGRNHNRRVLVVVEGNHQGDTHTRADVDQLDQASVAQPLAGVSPSGSATVERNALPTVTVTPAAAAAATTHSGVTAADVAVPSAPAAATVRPTVYAKAAHADASATRSAGRQR